MSRARGATRGDAFWTAATAGFGGLLQLAQLMVAARYLDAHALGVLAIVNVIAWIVLAFQDMGLSSYCVYLGDTTRVAHSTLFWISAGLGAFGALVVAGLGVSLATFYRMPELGHLMPLLSINLLLVGIGAQYQANLVRCFRARSLAKLELIARLAGFATAVLLLVVHGAGAEAIVIGLIIFTLSKLLLMGFLAESDWHPTYAFDRQLAPSALRYGAYQAGGQVVNQLRTQADQLLIGRVLGSEWLGVYSLAKELVEYPLRFARPLLSRLTLPVLARDRHDPDRLRRSFLASMRHVAVAGAITYGALACFSPWVVEILYGKRFSDVATLMPLLAVFGALRPLGMNIGMLAQATGATYLEFRWNLLTALITVPALLAVVLAWPSLAAFAVAVSVLQVVLTSLAYYWFVHPLQGVGMRAYVKTWGPSFGLSVALVGLALWLPVPALSEMGPCLREIWTRLMAPFFAAG